MVEQATNNTGEALDLLRRWAEAELHGDAATLASLLDAGFIAVGPFGFVLTKAEWLERYRSGDLKHQAFSWSDTSVREYGDTLILVGIQTQAAAYQGRPVPVTRLRATLIAVRRGGQRLIAGVHLSAIAQPPGD